MLIKKKLSQPQQEYIKTMSFYNTFTYNKNNKIIGTLRAKHKGAQEPAVKELLEILEYKPDSRLVGGIVGKVFAVTKISNINYPKFFYTFRFRDVYLKDGKFKVGNIIIKTESKYKFSYCRDVEFKLYRGELIVTYQKNIPIEEKDYIESPIDTYDYNVNKVGIPVNLTTDGKFKKKKPVLLYKEKEKGDKASSIYQGAYFDKNNKTWIAIHTQDTKSIVLGTFKTELEAAWEYSKYVTK